MRRVLLILLATVAPFGAFGEGTDAVKVGTQSHNVIAPIRQPGYSGADFHFGGVTVDGLPGGGGGGTWGTITGTLSAQTDLQSVLNGKESTLSFNLPLVRDVNTISIPVATTSTDGYLSHTDWNTFNGKQPAGAYLTANQNITISGDASGSGATAITLALGNIPDLTTQAGSILATNIAAPSTPASGKTKVYVDSTSKNIAVKNDAGVVNHGVQTKAAVGGQFITGINDDGTTSTGTAGGSPGGSNTQVQYNNSSAFGGTSGETTNGTVNTLNTPIFTGLPTGTGVATGATASTLAARDANANLSANNFLAGYRTTVTAAGTTTMVVGDAATQFFTGTTTQIVLMPVASTLVLGWQQAIYNNSTGAVTIRASGGAGNDIITLPGGSSTLLTCILTSGTSAASWSYSFLPITVASGKSETFSNTLTFAGIDASTLNIGAGGTLMPSSYAGITTHGDSIYSILATDSVVIPNVTLTASRIWTLPAASALAAGQPVTILDRDGLLGNGGGFTISIARAGSDTINGATASVVMDSQYQCLVLISDGVSKWTIRAPSIGEYVESIVAYGSAVALVSNTAKTITSITLSPGDWDVFGMGGYAPAATTSITQLTSGFSQITNSFNEADGYCESAMAAVVPGTTEMIITIPVRRYSLSTSTTIYLVNRAVFTVAGCSGYGRISARRMR